FWVSLSSNRRLLIWSPMAWGSRAGSFVFSHLSVIGRHGKKATQPCACGHLGSSLCRCSPEQVLRYRRKLSGPLLDRIDIQIEVPAVPADQLSRTKSGEASAVVRERVVAARERMTARQATANARLDAKAVEKFCWPDIQGEKLLKQAAQRFGISARG